MPLSEQELPDLMTRPKAAEFIGVSINTLDRMIADKRLEAFRVGNQVRISRAACLDMINRSSSLRANPPKRRAS